MDKLLHFFLSFILIQFLMRIFFYRTPFSKDLAPRFWQSEKQRLQYLAAMIVAFGLCLATAIGIMKEFGDSFGFGNVELADFIADLAGILTGYVLVKKQTRQAYRRRRAVSFRSQSNVKPIPSKNIFQPPDFHSHDGD